MNRWKVLIFFNVIILACILFLIDSYREKNVELMKDNMALLTELRNYSELAEKQNILMKRQALMIEGMVKAIENVRKALRTDKEVYL